MTRNLSNNWNLIALPQAAPKSKVDSSHSAQCGFYAYILAGAFDPPLLLVLLLLLGSYDSSLAYGMVIV